MSRERAYNPPVTTPGPEPMTTKQPAPTGLDLLRAPFPLNQISKLPKINCRACIESREKCCDRHKKSRCPGCESWITSGHIDLDFVGHAALTDRLLDADPAWTWEPVPNPEALGFAVLPGHSMWIKLTVCGVSRYGFGDAQGKGGGDAIKEIIGDALRNAAMRFGAALDLWHKGDLHVDDDTLGGLEHKDLVRKTLDDPKKADRSKGTPPADDPWASTPAAVPGSDGWLTEWMAEVEATDDLDVLRRQFTDLTDKFKTGQITEQQFDVGKGFSIARSEAVKS